MESGARYLKQFHYVFNSDLAQSIDVRHLPTTYLKSPGSMRIELNEGIASMAMRKSLKEAILLFASTPSGILSTNPQDDRLANQAESHIMLNTFLQIAVAIGVDEMVRFTIGIGAGIDNTVADSDDQTALMKAVHGGRYKTAELLLDIGASTNVRDKAGKDVLQIAVLSQTLFNERLHLMHIHGESREKISDEDRHLLSTQERHKTFIDSLSEARAQFPDIKPAEQIQEKMSEFLNALYEDSEQCQIINMLLNKGLDINVRTSNHETLLHLSIASAARLKLPILRGAGKLDINAETRSGKTVLHYAAAAGSLPSLKVLAEHGADMNKRVRKGATALHLGPPIRCL